MRIYPSTLIQASAKVAISLSTLYLTATLLLIWWVRNDRVCLLGVAGLLMWTALEKVIYQYGVIETNGTLAITFLFIGYNLIALYYFRHHLFFGLTVIGALTIAWTLWYSGDAYTFKATKNALYIAGLLWVTCIYIWPRRLSHS